MCFSAGASPDTIKTDLDLVGGIALVEQASNFNYRAPTNWDWNDRLPSHIRQRLSAITRDTEAKRLEYRRTHTGLGRRKDLVEGALGHT